MKQQQEATTRLRFKTTIHLKSIGFSNKFLWFKAPKRKSGIDVCRNTLWKLKTTYLYFLPAGKVRNRNFLWIYLFISGCQSADEPNITQSGRKVLFVSRKPNEQTGRRDNGGCRSATNHRGWVLSFRESAENTKLLKSCAHVSDTDETGLYIQPQRPATGWSDWFEVLWHFQ